MLDGPIVDVVIGLVFFYVALSLFVTTLQEWIASMFGLRSKNLEKGIVSMIGSKHAEKVYDHPLINGAAKGKRKPSYISAKTFRTVLDSVTQEIGNTDTLTKIFTALGVSKTTEEYQDRIERWFDDSMARIAGWYKRTTKLWVVSLAVLVTVATNANTFRMAEELWTSDALRTQIVAQAEAAVESDDRDDANGAKLTDVLGTLPIGWKAEHWSWSSGWREWLHMILGLGITVAAVSLGAPFWFDVLGRVANIRGSGAPEGRATNLRK